MYGSEKEKISMHCILASLYFLLLPLTIATNSGGDSILKLVSIPIAIYFVCTLVFEKKEFNINIVHILLAVYTLGTLISFVVDPNPDSFNVTLGGFLNTALYICLSVVQYNKSELKLLESIQIVLLVILTIIPIFNGITDSERTSLVIFGEKCDPNYFVGFFIFPISVALKRICQSRFRLIYVTLVFFAMYVIFLTGSRGGLFAIATTFCAFALIYTESISKKIFVLFVIIASIIAVWYILKPYLPEMILKRMSVDVVVKSRGTYRMDIWNVMFDDIRNSKWEIFTGRGMYTHKSVFINGLWHEVVAHNHMIQLLYNQGITGVITFSTLVIGCIVRCIRKRKCVSVALIGMIALSVSLSFGPSTKAFWNMIPYAAFAFAVSGGRTVVGKESDDAGTLINNETDDYTEEKQKKSQLKL